MVIFQPIAPLLAAVRLLRGKSQPQPQPQMKLWEKEVIRRLAAGDKDCRQQAIDIHRQYIPILGVRGTPEQDFMAEVDNPVPDLILRAKYRETLLKQH